MAFIMKAILFTCTCQAIIIISYQVAQRQPGIIPEEQRLFSQIMKYYQSNSRPVKNASTVVMVDFNITLNQIVDLDERLQVLTTNVFINQEWWDENLVWNVDEFNGIKNIRAPASSVWLPDTFIFNNADDGSTGFMRGAYVLINNFGRIKWPVPMKLRSSCKVNIKYFPFDYQVCTLRFGSWIYSAEWIDFNSSLKSVDLSNYMDNSEWQLLSIDFKKEHRQYACCEEYHTDIIFKLSMRRRTFYYIWNVIVPCVMLSALTLLTFWLPSTSGEKISLGLSVFLAFSMFMLLIAEEVPATSESVPLIGIYLTIVMTMTSASVIMAVMVINLYNRGAKAKKAPKWLKIVVLKWICRFLRMKHDIERIAQNIRLKEEEEEKYKCGKHPGAKINQKEKYNTTISGNLENLYPDTTTSGNSNSTTSVTTSPDKMEKDKLSRRFSTLSKQNSDEEPVWLKRTPLSAIPAVTQPKPNYQNQMEKKSAAVVQPQAQARKPSMINNNKLGLSSKQSLKGGLGAMAGLTLPGISLGVKSPTANPATDTISKLVAAICKKEAAMVSRKEMIVEWQTIATVIDRLLFWVVLVATVLSYIIVLFVVPEVASRRSSYIEKGTVYVLME